MCAYLRYGKRPEISVEYFCYVTGIIEGDSRVHKKPQIKEHPDKKNKPLPSVQTPHIMAQNRGEIFNFFEMAQK